MNVKIILTNGTKKSYEIDDNAKVPVKELIKKIKEDKITENEIVDMEIS